MVSILQFFVYFIIKIFHYFIPYKITCYNRSAFNFIFTDDPSWVTKNFTLNYSFKIVDINHGDESFFDMYLMSLCKSNIIANSSFGWWGAWLNNSKDKVVYAPKNWFKDKKIKTDDLIPKSWILI